MSFDDIEWVKYRMEQEGTGYFFTGYCSAKDMPDEKSKELFQKALDGIVEFEDYVNGKYVEMLEE